MSSSFVTPCIRGLQTKVDSLSAKYHLKLLSTLKASIDKRLKVYLNETTFVLAAILDPRYKLQWCSSVERLEHEKTLTEAANAQNVSIPEHDSGCEEPPRKKSKTCDENDLLSFMTLPTEPNTTTTCASPVAEEVKQYLTEPLEPRSADPLIYWSTHQSRMPHLAKLAAVYLHVPASSAPVERLFSVAGCIFRPDRCLLKDKTFERLLFIKCNKSVM